MLRMDVSVRFSMVFLSTFTVKGTGPWSAGPWHLTDAKRRTRRRISLKIVDAASVDGEKN
jgi:hypothetical protein